LNEKLRTQNRHFWHRFCWNHSDELDRRAIESYTSETFKEYTDEEWQNIIEDLKGIFNYSYRGIMGEIESFPRFMYCDFSAIDFSGYYFPNYVDFGHSRFCAYVSFSKAFFANGANFSNAVFDHFAVFQKAEFHDETSFLSVIFNLHTNFNEVVFTDVDFLDSTFMNGASFISARFFEEANFECVTFKSTTDFTCAEFERSPTFHGADLYVNTIWDDVKWPQQSNDPNIAKLDIPNWATLKLLMNQVMRHDAELDFHAKELEARKAAGKGVLVSFLYEIFSDYGRRISRPLIWLLGVLVLITVIKMDLLHIDSPDSMKTIYDRIGPAFKYSLFNSLPFVPISKLKEFYPTGLSFWEQMLAVAQYIFSLLMWFLAGLGLRNRFRIK